MRETIFLVVTACAACGAEPAPVAVDGGDAAPAAADAASDNGCPTFPGIPVAVCGGFCNALNTVRHCGACNNTCAVGQRCVEGTPGTFACAR